MTSASTLPPSVTGPQAVTFTVGDLRFALEVGHVREIVRGVSPVRVPHAPADVAGIIDWRGRLIPLIDLRARFGMGCAGQAEHARVIVVETGGGARAFGIAVDKVHTIVRFDRSDLRPRPAATAARGLVSLPDVQAIEGTDLILLDPEMFASNQSLN